MKAQDLTQVRRTLWAAADEMRANSSLTPPEYRGPVLGLIFLAYAEQRFDETAQVEETEASVGRSRPTTTDAGASSTFPIKPNSRTWSPSRKARTSARRSTMP